MDGEKILPAKPNLWDRLNGRTPKGFELWARTRTKGRRRFVLLWGVCWFASWMLFCNDLVPAGWRFLHHQTAFSRHISDYIFDAVWYPIAGYIFGALLWSHMEKKFREYSGAIPPQQPGA